MPSGEWEIAKITNVTLGYEDHGILTCGLTLDYGSSSRGAGGYALDSYDEEKKRRIGTAFGMEFIIRLLRACGVNEWSKLKGRTVFALTSWNKVYGIKPLPTEEGEEFIFDDLSKECYPEEVSK